MKTTHVCKIVKKQEIAPGIIDVTVKNAQLTADVQPGQFIHIKCGDETAMPLRRPISICDVNGDELRFIFQVKGAGTAALAQLEGELDIMGPLGNPFTVDNDTYRQPALIGGGIGTYPLYLLGRKLQNPKVYLGFRTKELVTLEDEFRTLDDDAKICTDDGSYGYKCFAITPLEMDIKAGKVDIIYACGPLPMLKSVKQVADKHHIKCQISMEQRMGCGIGACLTCSCETTSPGTWKYKRVCKNGPVFWSDDLVL